MSLHDLEDVIPLANVNIVRIKGYTEFNPNNLDMMKVTLHTES